MNFFVMVCKYSILQIQDPSLTMMNFNSVIAVSHTFKISLLALCIVSKHYANTNSQWIFEVPLCSNS